MRQTLAAFSCAAPWLRTCEGFDCWAFKHSPSKAFIGTQLRKKVTCGRSVESCILYVGSYAMPDHYIAAHNPSEPYHTEFYDGGCGPPVAAQDFDQNNVTNYRDANDHEEPFKVRQSKFEKCGRRKVEMDAYSAERDMTYRLKWMGRLSRYPYGDPRYDVDEDFVRTFGCDQPDVEPGIAAVCYDNLKDDEEWLDCHVPYRVHVCFKELCNTAGRPGFASPLISSVALLLLGWTT